jgi:hypothetical protein
MVVARFIQVLKESQRQLRLVTANIGDDLATTGARQRRDI